MSTETMEKPESYKSTERARKKRKTRRRVWIILGVVFVLAAGAGAYYQFYYLPGQEVAETENSQMQTATIRTGDLVLYASGAGELIAGNEENLSFPASAEVSAIYVKVGDHVKSGDVLVEQDVSSLQEAYEEAQRNFNELVSSVSIAEARQSVSSIAEDLYDSQTTLKYLISPGVFTYETRLVEAQNALAQAQTEGDDDAISTAEQAVANAEAGLKQAQYYYDNTYAPEYFTVEECEGVGRERVCEEYISEPTLSSIDDARFTVELNEALLKEAQDYLALLTTGELPEGATGSEIGAYLTVKEELETAKENLQSSQLVASIDGVVTAMNAAVGSESGTDTIVTISDTSSLILQVYVDAEDWDMFVVGYEADITFDLIPDRVFTGEVTQVDPFIETDFGGSMIGGSVSMDITNQVGIETLPLGSSADVEIIGGRAEQAVLVPVEALREVTDGQYSVFVIENGEPVLRLVDIGIIDIYYAEVISGLSAGEVVSTGIVETE